MTGHPGQPGRLASQVTMPRRDRADGGASPYARPHPAAGPPPAADPGANRLGSPEDWVHDHRPRRPVTVPDGHLAVQLMNAHLGAQPGDVIILPREQAAEWVRQGYARPVTAG